MRKHLRPPLRRPAARLQTKPSTAALSSDPVEAVSMRRRFLEALLLLAAVTFSCGLLYCVSGPAGFLWPSIRNLLPPGPARSPTDTDISEVSLEIVLEKAAMVDKTVILTTLNAAWASPNSVIDLFLESFQIGDRTSRLLKHLVIVALDQKAYARCKSIHIHCYALMTEGMDFSGEKAFMTDGYLEMMWRRIDFLRIVLEMGYDFIFTDTDVMWFRDPLPHFYPDGDFQIACDHFLGNSSDLRNIVNGGFNYVKSSHRTIEFYKFWLSSREDYPGYHDQDVLNFIKHDLFIRDIGLSMKFLDTDYFGGLCEPSRDFNKCCRCSDVHMAGTKELQSCRTPPTNCAYITSPDGEILGGALHAAPCFSGISSAKFADNKIFFEAGGDGEQLPLISICLQMSALEVVSRAKLGSWDFSSKCTHQELYPVFAAQFKCRLMRKRYCISRALQWIALAKRLEFC